MSDEFKSNFLIKKGKMAARGIEALSKAVKSVIGDNGCGEVPDKVDPDLFRFFQKEIWFAERQKELPPEWVEAAREIGYAECCCLFGADLEELSRNGKQRIISDGDGLWPSILLEEGIPGSREADAWVRPFDPLGREGSSSMISSPIRSPRDYARSLYVLICQISKDRARSDGRLPGNVEVVVLKHRHHPGISSLSWWVWEKTKVGATEAVCLVSQLEGMLEAVREHGEIVLIQEVLSWLQQDFGGN